MYQQVVPSLSQAFIGLSLLCSLLTSVRPGGKAINVNQLGAQAAIEALWDPATGVGSQDTVRQNLFTNTEDSWNFWWSYSGISGPKYWGLINPDWQICDKGARQSPINIETNALVYDPDLTPLHADNNLVSGLLYNDGHAIVFNCSMQSSELTLFGLESTSSSNPIKDSSEDSRQNASEPTAARRARRKSDHEISFELSQAASQIGQHGSSSLQSNYMMADNQIGDAGSDQAAGLANADDPQAQARVHFNGAGLPYAYKFEALYLRFGLDESPQSGGSEHRINSRAFPAELQLVAYNSLLYRSFSEAATKPFGLMAVAVLIEVVKEVNQAAHLSQMHGRNQALESLLANLDSVKHRGLFVPLRNFSVASLLSEAENFVTYEGSLTTPACHESVHWILLNKPLYIKKTQLDLLRSISAGEPSEPQAANLLAGNIRPLQSTNGRPVRTNIRPATGSADNQDKCPMLRVRYSYNSKSQRRR